MQIYPLTEQVPPGNLITLSSMLAGRPRCGVLERPSTFAPVLSMNSAYLNPRTPQGCAPTWYSGDVFFIDFSPSAPKLPRMDLNHE